MSRIPRGLAPLRHRGFRLLAAGQLASNTGDAFYAVALPWYVLSDHGGELLLGTVLAAYGIPRTVLLAVGGQASDRWGPWTVMMASDGVRVLAAAALAVAAATGPARAVILVPIAVVLGAGEGMFLPGSFSIIPALLPDADLQAGNALASAGTQLATLIGPALGGAMVALAGPSPAFALDAASFAISTLTLVRVRAAQRTPAPVASETVAPGAVTPTAVAPPAVAPETVAPGAVAPGAGSRPGDAASPDGRTVRGLLRSERVLQLALLVTVVANLGSGGIDGVALPSLAHGPLHTGAGGFGALIAAFGAGALLGTLVAAHVGRARRPALAGSAAFLAEAVFMAVIPYLGNAFGAAAALIGLGAMNGFGNVVMITAFQRWAPPDMLGRLSGLLMLASVGVFPVSVVVAAFVVHDLGPAPFFPLAAAVLALAIGLGLSQRSWRNFGATPDTSGPIPDHSQPDTVPAAPQK
jgi:predicted MFS family arabinose efflux permease